MNLDLGCISALGKATLYFCNAETFGETSLPYVFQGRPSSESHILDTLQKTWLGYGDLLPAENVGEF